MQKLERQCDVSSTQLANLQEENLTLSHSNNLLKDQLEIALLEQRKLSEKGQLQGNHIGTLETLL